MKTKPTYLIPSCGKSRAAILAWLQSEAKWTSRHFHGDGSFRFCFNVKAYHCDLSFENLWKRHVVSGYAESTSERYKAECAALYEDNQNHLWEWGVEDAQRQITDDDAFNTLWNGKPAATEKGFFGRSGGWLVLQSFRGIKLDADCELDSLDYATLKDLAEMVQWFAYCTEGKKPDVAIEEAAAFCFFVNICAPDIESDKDEAERLASESRVQTL